MGVTLEVPVWVPARAQRLKTYCGFEKKWQTVALTTPRASGFVWFVPTMREVNDKANYRPEAIHVEVNSKFAPWRRCFWNTSFGKAGTTRPGGCRSYRCGWGKTPTR